MFRLFIFIFFLNFLRLCQSYIKNLYGSQPEDGFMKKAETCCCYDFL